MLFTSKFKSGFYMEDQEHYKSNLTDFNKNLTFGNEPKKYQTVNLEGSYCYADPKEVDESATKKSGSNNSNVLIFVSWLSLVALLIIGLIFLSFNTRNRAGNDRRNLIKGQSTDENSASLPAEQIVVSKLGRPIGCSFYLNKNIINGLYIDQIHANGPADEAGLASSDQIISIDSQRIESIGDVLNIFKSKESGDKVIILYSRDGIEAEATLILDLSRD